MVSQLITGEQISLNQNSIYLAFKGIRLHGKCSLCGSVRGHLPPYSREQVSKGQESTDDVLFCLLTCDVNVFKGDTVVFFLIDVNFLSFSSLP